MKVAELKAAAEWLYEDDPGWVEGVILPHRE